jgi:hypothetical protein
MDQLDAFHETPVEMVETTDSIVSVVDYLDAIISGGG